MSYQKTRTQAEKNIARRSRERWAELSPHTRNLLRGMYRNAHQLYENHAHARFCVECAVQALDCEAWEKRMGR